MRLTISETLAGARRLDRLAGGAGSVDAEGLMHRERRTFFPAAMGVENQVAPFVAGKVSERCVGGWVNPVVEQAARLEKSWEPRSRQTLRCDEV